MTLLAAGGFIVGAIVVGLAPWRLPARRFSPQTQPQHDLQIFVLGGAGWGAAVALVAVLVHPLLSALVFVWPTVRRGRARRVQGSDQRRAVLRSLPETTDLIALGVGAGAPVRVAVRHAAEWADEPFRAVFVETLRRSEVGEPFAVALEAAAAEIDSIARPLIGLLATAEADGGGLLAGLVRVSDDARRRRHHAAAARAQRLPVTMLLPLVLCVLPAFVLLAVAPLVLTSLGELNLGL